MDSVNKTAGDEPRLIKLKSMPHAFGELVVAEAGILPFEPRRTYFVHGIPAHAKRGGHAHIKTREAIVALHGSFSATVERIGQRPEVFTLQNPNEALLVPPLCWIALNDFSKEACFLVVASEPYDEADYIRDRASFEKLAHAQ